MMVPTVTVFGFDELRKRRPNGVFKFKEMLTGSPAGALPFLLTTLFGVTLSLFITPLLPGVSARDVSAIQPNLVLVIGFTILLWGFARAVSAGLTTIRSAKLLTTVLAIALVSLPALFLSVTTGDDFNSPTNFPWLLYPFRSIFGPDEHLGAGFVWGVLFGVSGGWLAFYGEKRVQKNLLQPRFRLYFEGQTP
jgi:hypothetical protein